MRESTKEVQELKGTWVGRTMSDGHDTCSPDLKFPVYTPFKPKLNSLNF